MYIDDLYEYYIQMLTRYNKRVEYKNNQLKQEQARVKYGNHR